MFVFLISESRIKTREEVWERVARATKLSYKTLDLTDSVPSFGEDDGDWRTAWGFAQKLTRVSQLTPYQDDRDRLDRAAGRLLALAA
jgi:hypothetical protein